MRYLSIFLLVFLLNSLLSSCSKNPNVELTQWTVMDRGTLVTDGLVPNSYLVSSSVSERGDTLFYWDNAKTQLVLVNQSFRWLENLGNGKGSGPEEVAFHSGHGLAQDKFFILGMKALVYDASDLSFIGKYKLPEGDIEWLVEFGNRLVMGGLFYEENRYIIYSASFSRADGFTDVREELEISFPERLDELSKVTTAELMDNHLYVFKTHLGELVKIDQDFNTLFDKTIPFSVGRKDNLQTFENGEQDINTIEAWDFTTHNGRIYVLRHVDLANPQLKADEVHRKTLHVLNSDAQAIAYTHLPRKAFYISFVGNQLFAIDHKEERYVNYEIFE